MMTEMMTAKFVTGLVVIRQIVGVLLRRSSRIVRIKTIDAAIMQCRGAMNIKHRGVAARGANIAVLLERTIVITDIQEKVITGRTEETTARILALKMETRVDQLIGHPTAHHAAVNKERVTIEPATRTIHHSNGIRPNLRTMKLESEKWKSPKFRSLKTGTSLLIWKMKTKWDQRVRTTKSEYLATE